MLVGIGPDGRHCILASSKCEGRNLMEDRIDYFERMLADNPDNPTGLLALANEYEKAGRDEDEAAVLERYLAVQVDDEGNAYARLGSVLSNLGRKDEARAAYEKGIAQSEKHGHSGMADDLRLALIQLNESILFQTMQPGGIPGAPGSI